MPECLAISGGLPGWPRYHQRLGDANGPGPMAEALSEWLITRSLFPAMTGAGVEDVPQDLLADAEAASRVLDIDHHQVELPVGDQAGKELAHHMASAAPDHVADEQDPHAGFLGRQSMTSRSVRM